METPSRLPETSRARHQVSTAGGTFARWSRDGKPLFMAPEGRFLALRYVDAQGQVGRSDLILVQNFTKELKALGKP